MAAKKPTTIDDLVEQGLLMRGDDKRLEIHRLSTGIPPLDDITGGGLPYGRNVLCVGPESTAKTLIAQYIAAAAQRQGKQVLLVDAEMSYMASWWAESGVNTSDLLVSQPPSGEAAVNLIINMVRTNKELGLIVVDSIAALSPTAVLEKSSGEKTVASLATLVNDLYTKLMPINKHVVFFAINQLRDNMNGYDDQYPGGRRLHHDSHIILRTRRKEFMKQGEERVGQVIEVLARKNKMGQPMGECELAFRFRGQLDKYTSFVEEALERGIILNAGPYYFWHRAAENEVKWLGKGAVRDWFAADDEAFERLKAELEVKVA